jgi:quinohemoprotein amine dehydrogenase alpha subunit-like protein
VTSISPTALGQGATNQNVSIVGTNFVNGATFSGSGPSVGGITLNSTTFVDSSHITVNVSIAANAPTGVNSLTLTNPDGIGATCTNCFTVDVGPTVTSTSPSSRGQGATNQTVTVVGTNFVSGATAVFSGTGITVNSTTFTDSSHLSLNISVAPGAATGARNVTVTNPDFGTSTGTGVFTVNAGPTVTSTSPSSLARGATGQTVTVVGTNFVSGATAAFSGTGITINSTTFTNSTHLTLNVTIAAGAATGARNVTVTNPDAGAGTGTGVFTVT